MSVPPEQFSRIASRINLDWVGDQLVVVIGVGTVGSQIALELVRSGVGNLRLIDGDLLEKPNIARHALANSYIGRNKAEAMTEFLADELGVTHGEAVPHMVDEAIADDQLDELLSDAFLILSATDSETVQRRIAERALALDICAVLPALYRRGGGEVFVQLSPEFPCYLCWAAHRHEGQPIRAVDALNVDAGGIINLAATLCLGLLDSASEFHQLLQPEPGQQQPQLFVRNQVGTAVLPIQWRPNCPSCAVGPARPVAGSGAPASALSLSSELTDPPTAQGDSRDIEALIGNLIIAILFLAGAVVFIGVGLERYGRAHDESLLSPLLALIGIFSLSGGVYAVWRAFVDIFVEEPRAWWWQYLTGPFRSP